MMIPFKSKMKTILIAVAVLLPLFCSCTDDFDTYNRDKNEISKLNTLLYAAAFSKAQNRMVYWYDCDMHDISNMVTLHGCGYSIAGFPQADMYVTRNNWTQNAFDDQTTAIFGLQALMEAAKDDNPVVYHMALVMRSYCFLLMTDVWGPIPYKDMGNGAQKVSYESQKEVYYQLFEDLKTASSFLGAEVKKNPNLNVFGEGDHFFYGKVAQWVKFANVIRLRMALRISNVEPEKAKAEGEAAIAEKMLLTQALTDDIQWDIDAKYRLSGTSDNGYITMNSYGELIMSNNMESFMVGWNDPRLKEYWSPTVEEGWNAADYPQFAYRVGGYHGMASGTPHAKKDPVYLSHSKLGPRFHPDLQGKTPTPIFNAAETSFLLAEAAWRGWAGAGDMKTNYENGIRESMKQWGITDNAAIEAYIVNTAKPKSVEYTWGEVINDVMVYQTVEEAPLSTIPVKFSGNKEEQYEQIMTQKWLATFPNSTEAWSEYRRTRLPKIYPKKASANPNVDVTKGQIFVRLPYPDDEIASNPEGVQQAIGFLGGPNLETTPLWWDVHPNGK